MEPRRQMTAQAPGPSRQHGLRLAGLRLAGLRLAGGGLLVATGAIHLDLYLTGYRSLPAIGWLFLLQVIAAFGLAAAGAGFALATLGGYLLSVWVGLFGFKEIRTTAGIVAGVAEVAAFAALVALAAAFPATRGQRPAGPTSAPPEHSAPSSTAGACTSSPPRADSATGRPAATGRYSATPAPGHSPART
jgi:hypothetical protein